MCSSMTRRFPLPTLFLLLAVCLGCTAEAPPPITPKTEAATAQPSPDPPSSLRLAVVGDIMMHDTQIRSGKTASGTYNYDAFFQEIQPWLAQADLAVGNLETTLPGNGKPWSGYPMFRSPDALGDSLKKAGFDLLSTANNHTMDAGESGVVRTHRKLTELGIQPIGTSPGPEPQKPLLIEKNGITLSFSAYTYGTNGIPLPAGKDYLVNLIDENRILKEIRESRERGADIVVVMLHFGQEYQRQPNGEQKRLVKKLLTGGADVVLGGHPHVLQPMERRKAEGKEKFVIYSLGNFVSDQLKTYTNDGIILYLDLHRTSPDHPVQLQQVSYLPTYVHKYRQGGVRKFTVIPIEGKGKWTGPTYPGLSEQTLKRTWRDTTTLMESLDSFPVFSPPAEKTTSQTPPSP